MRRLYPHSAFCTLLRQPVRVVPSEHAQNAKLPYTKTEAGYLPEARFRRHSPRNTKRRRLWRCKAAAMWTFNSSVGTSVGLTRQSSNISFTQSPRSVTASTHNV